MIGKAANQLDIPETTIRHWLKEELLIVKRDPESNYHMFDEAAIQMLLTIKMIKMSTWSLEEVRHVLKHFDPDSPDELLEQGKQSSKRINDMILRHLIANKYIYDLICYLNPHFMEDFPAVFMANQMYRKKEGGHQDYLLFS